MRREHFDRHAAASEQLHGVGADAAGYRAELDRLDELAASIADHDHTGKYTPQALLEHRRAVVEERLVASLPEGFDVAASITAAPEAEQLRAIAAALRAFPTGAEATARPELSMPRARAKPAPLTSAARLRRRP